MPWYDEEEDEDQNPFANIDFGVNDDDGPQRFMNFTPQTNPSDLYDMSELYNVPDPQFKSDAADAYGKYVQTEPKQGDFKNKWWQNLAGGFIGGVDAVQRGVAAGRQTRQSYLDQPYNRARQEWSQRARQMGEQARIEQARNAQERQRYQTQLQAAQGKLTARRQGALAQNTLATGASVRETNATRRKLMPLAQFNSGDGNVTQFNRFNPSEKTVIGKGAFDTPAARDQRQTRTLGAAAARQSRSIAAADARQVRQQTYQTGENVKYRRTADDLNVPKPAAAKADKVEDILGKAMLADEYDTLRSSGILKGGEGGIEVDRTQLDEIKGRVQKAIDKKQPVNAQDFEILREWSLIIKKMGM